LNLLKIYRNNKKAHYLVKNIHSLALGLRPGEWSPPSKGKKFGGREKANSKLFFRVYIIFN
jgi:hypothetical protein